MVDQCLIHGHELAKVAFVGGERRGVVPVGGQGVGEHGATDQRKAGALSGAERGGVRGVTDEPTRPLNPWDMRI
jgi:hypothetical protein